MGILQDDIKAVIKKKELFDFLDKKTVFVTGATGLIGSMLIRCLLLANKEYNLSINVTGQIRDDDKAKRLFGDEYSKIKFVYSLDEPADYIVHTLSPTVSKFFVEQPVETIKVAVSGTMEILENARKNNSSVIYLSSMEQYGVPYKPGQVMKEEDIGVIDHLNVRSSYSESKRLCENLCAAYASEYDLDVKIARLSQTFGTGVPLTDNRMPMQFARAVADNNNIILHTTGESISNFVYITDALSGILTIMKNGSSGQAYNICNDKETRSVRDIAELVAKEVAGNRIAVNVEIPKESMGYAPATNMYLDSTKLRNIGWSAEVDMKEAYTRLVKYLKGE